MRRLHVLLLILAYVSLLAWARPEQVHAGVGQIAAVVRQMFGGPIDGSSATDGQALVWNDTTKQWDAGSPSTSAGASIADVTTMLNTVEITDGTNSQDIWTNRLIVDDYIHLAGRNVDEGHWGNVGLGIFCAITWHDGFFPATAKQYVELGPDSAAGSLYIWDPGATTNSRLAVYNVAGTNSVGIQHSGTNGQAKLVTGTSGALADVEMNEVIIPETSTPTGVANTAKIYVDDSGGKSRLMVIFGSGAAQQIAIEP